MMKDRFELQDKVILVTGAAGLLGSHFCEVLLESNARVVAADIDIPKLKQLAEQLQSKGYTLDHKKMDVTSSESVHAVIEDIKRDHGRLDVLVHCAAIDPKFDAHAKSEHSHSYEDFPLQAWQTALNINLTGAFLVTQETARVMHEQGSGVIILFSSIYGLVAPDQRLYPRGSYKPPYYSVSKSGILGLTRYLAAYFAGTKIRVNAISPGGIYNNHDAQFTESYAARTIMGRMADISELDGTLIFLASDASSYMTGANVVVDGGWTAW